MQKSEFNANAPPTGLHEMKYIQIITVICLRAVFDSDREHAFSLQVTWRNKISRYLKAKSMLSVGCHTQHEDEWLLPFDTCKSKL